jgi:predicted DNA-binding protein
MSDLHSERQLEAAAAAVAAGDVTFDFAAHGVTPPPVPDEEAMVVRSLRLPLDLDRRLKAAASRRGVAMSTLLREWIELELAGLEDDRPISRADALRALASLRPVA